MPEQRQQLQGRGRGRSSGGRGQRGAGRRGHSQNQGRGQVNKKKLILPDDAEKELGDNIYIINHSGQADKYVKTTEAILNYIQKTYKNGEDLKKALKREQDLDFTVLEPTAPGTIDNTTPAGFKYKLEMEQHYRRLNQYETNKSNAHALIYGQCSLAVKNKLQARKDWDVVQEDPFKLLIAIKEITHNYQDSRYYIGTVATAI